MICKAKNWETKSCPGRTLSNDQSLFRALCVISTGVCRDRGAIFGLRGPNAELPTGTGAGRTIIEGANIHIFVFTDCLNNRFQKKLIKQNARIWIFAPPQLSFWRRHCLRGGKRGWAVSSLGWGNSNRNVAVQNVFHKLVQDRKIFNIQLEMTIL